MVEVKKAVDNFPKENTTICIIIPHLNEKEMLLNLLESIDKKTDYHNYVIVVIDNGSRDGSVSAIQSKFPNVKIIRNEKNLGFSKAVNQAIKAFPAKYYFLLNNDTLIIQLDWLSRLLKIMEKNPDLGILGTKQIPPKQVPEFLRKIEQTGISENFFLKKFICYGQVMVRSKVFSTIGLLDEDFSPAYVDDLDHCYRALKFGWKMAEIPSIRILHLECITGNKLKSFKDYLILRNRLLYILYNFGLLNVIAKISIIYLRMIYDSLIKLKLSINLYLTPKILWFFIKNLFPVLKKRAYRIRDLSYTTPINFH